jgi:hypothetical protein
VLFFGIFGFPRNSLNFVVDLLFIIVITLLTFAFTLSTISSNKLNSLGIKGNNEVLHKYEPFNYVSSFEQYPTTYNPATGLPMGGGVDARGNPYGLNNH